MEELPKRSPEFAQAVSYNGVSLWEASAFHIFYLFFEAFKYVKATRKIIEVEEPNKLIIVGDKDSFLFWHNIEQAFCERNLLRKIASWIANSRRAAIGEEIAYEVASVAGIPVSRMPTGLGSHLRHYFIFHLLPPFYRSFLRFEDLRRRISQRNLTKAGIAVPSQNKICFFVGSRNVSIAAAPVVMELRKDEGNEVLVIGVDSPMTGFTHKALKEEGIPYQTYETYINGEVRRKTARGVKFRRRRWNGLKKDENFPQLIGYDGMPLWSVLKDRFSYIFSIMLPETIKHIETVNHLIDVEKPDIFVLTNELSPIERAAAFIARSIDIPSLDLQSMAYSKREIPIPISTDKTAVGGDLIRQLVIKRKGEAFKDRLVITGDPRFEYMLQTMKDFNKDEFRKQLGLGVDKTTVLFTSTPVQLAATAEIREQLCHCVYNAIKKLPDMQFVVKLHPGEGFDLHYKLKVEMKVENVIITKDTNLYHLLDTCDLVMSFLSTTLLEAMIMEKPVIEINLTGIPDQLPYVESGAAIGVYREEDLLPSIKDALYNKEVRERLAEARRRFVYQYAYIQDGQASKRVADLVMQMIEESRKGGTRN